MYKTVFPAKLEKLELMIEFIREGTEKHGFGSKDVNRVRLAAEEVLVNIISYAYPDNSGDIEIRYDTNEGNGLVIEIIDWGIPFDPLSIPEPDIEARIEDREIGGLGIYMVRKIMDEVSYRREADRNILTLVKY